MYRSLNKRVFLKEILNYIPDVRLSDLKPRVAGVRAQAVSSNGDLIDDNIVISVLSEKVENLNNEQILIDGFPRSSIQAESLNNIFKDLDVNIINFIGNQRFMCLFKFSDEFF